jgi:hypothetical protein
MAADGRGAGRHVQGIAPQLLLETAGQAIALDGPGLKAATVSRSICQSIPAQLF